MQVYIDFLDLRTQSTMTVRGTLSAEGLASFTAPAFPSAGNYAITMRCRCVSLPYSRRGCARSIHSQRRRPNMRGFHRDCVVYVGNEPLLVQLLVYAHLTDGWRDPAPVPSMPQYP